MTEATEHAHTQAIGHESRGSGGHFTPHLEEPV